MRIVSLSFGGISNGRPAGMSRLLLPIYQELGKCHGVKVVHYVPQCSGYSGDVEVRSLSPLYTMIYRFIRVAGRLLHVPSYLTRHLSLDIYDLFAKRKIKQAQTLVITHFFPRTLRKNEALGGKNILIMGNPNPDLVYGFMMDIQKKYRVTIRDAYTYKPFIIGRWHQSAGFLDSIVCGSKTMKKTFNSSLQCAVVNPPCILVTEHYLLNGRDFARNITDSGVANTRQLRFCFLAHTVWLKGLHNLLEAWEMLDTPNAELHIGGRINSHYKKWIDARFSINNAVIYHGRVLDLREFYMSNDVFVCPSLADAGPGTIAEALSRGLPVIASNGCGLSELITDGYNGYVFPAGDAQSLCDCLRKCIDNKAMVKEMSSRAIDSIHEAAVSSAHDYADFLYSHLNSIEAK